MPGSTRFRKAAKRRRYARARRSEHIQQPSLTDIGRCTGCGVWRVLLASPCGTCGVIPRVSA